jgi:hypothetical protein
VPELITWLFSTERFSKRMDEETPFVGQYRRVSRRHKQIQAQSIFEFLDLPFDFRGTGIERDSSAGKVLVISKRNSGSLEFDVNEVGHSCLSA